MKKRVLGLMGAFLLVPSVVFAVPVAITWEWTLEDPDVTTFRYQINGEDDASWTVVDATQRSYTAEDLDGSLSYTLYLQQSYDGVHFSVSATSTSEPLSSPALAEEATGEEKPAAVEQELLSDVAENGEVQPADEQVFPEEAVDQSVATEEMAPLAEQEEIVSEPLVGSEESPLVEEVQKEEPVAGSGEAEPVVDDAVLAEPEEEPSVPQADSVVAAKPVRERAPLRFGFGLYGGASYLLDKDSYIVSTNDHTWIPSLGGELKIENIFAGKHFGLGLDLKGAWMPDANVEWKDTFDSSAEITNGLDGSALLEIDLNFGKSLFTLGAGGFGSYDFDNWSYGIAAGAGFGYHLTKHFYLGLDGQYRYYLYGNKKAQTVGGTMSFLFTF